MIDNQLIDKLLLEGEKDTHRIASLLSNEVEPGDVICLNGDLGVGKTSFARAFIRALTSEDEPVPSPTYTLIQHYNAKRIKVGLEIFHVDLYRISCHSEIEELGLEDALGMGVSLIEWPELSIPRLPEDRLEIYLQFGKGVSERYMDLFGSSRWLSLAHSIEGSLI